MQTLREYLRPSSVDQAIDMVRKGPGRGGYIAGGTFLGMARRISYDYLVDITHLKLHHIKREKGLVRLGATATIQALADSPVVESPQLHFLGQAARCVAGRQIRNMATVAGDLVSGYQLVDLPAALLVLDAELVLAGSSMKRIPLQDFYRTRPLQDERGWLVTEIVFSWPPPESRGFFTKVARTEYDVAILNMACLARTRRGIWQDVRVAVGAAVSKPVRLKAVEEILTGQQVKEGILEQAVAGATLDLSLLDNIRGTQTFRKEILRVWLRRALRACSQGGGTCR